MGYGPWGMGFWEFFILLWLVLWFLKPRDSKRWENMWNDFNSTHAQEKAGYEETMDAYEADLDAAEARIEKLEERIRVLERIVTDEHKTNSLADEIDNLRKQA